MSYKKPKEEDEKKTKFWRILKKREGKQDILLTKRKKPRQEPLDTVFTVEKKRSSKDKKFQGHTTYETKEYC